MELECRICSRKNTSENVSNVSDPIAIKTLLAHVRGPNVGKSTSQRRSVLSNPTLKKSVDVAVKR